MNYCQYLDTSIPTPTPPPIIEYIIIAVKTFIVIILKS